MQGFRLNEYYRQLEKYGGAGVWELENGRFCFYGDLTPARTSGEMAGIRIVREWNPATGSREHGARLSTDQEYSERCAEARYGYSESSNIRGEWKPHGAELTIVISMPTRENLIGMLQRLCSGESIVQVLSHEIYEIEDLRYIADKPISVAEYRNHVRPNLKGNLHFQAVQEGDASVKEFLKFKGQ